MMEGWELIYVGITVKQNSKTKGRENSPKVLCNELEIIAHVHSIKHTI